MVGGEGVAPSLLGCNPRVPLLNDPPFFAVAQCYVFRRGTVYRAYPSVFAKDLQGTFFL